MRVLAMDWSIGDEPRAFNHSSLHLQLQQSTCFVLARPAPSRSAWAWHRIARAGQTWHHFAQHAALLTCTVCIAAAVLSRSRERDGVGPKWNPLGGYGAVFAQGRSLSAS